MTDSVWWYVLAGLMLGFILSTLWEWLYFRYRRMRIESRRIAELEATVRSLSAVSRSTENGAPTGFAAGYQSPGVFLEGEEDDVDTVEVIVPASPEPLPQEPLEPAPTGQEPERDSGLTPVAAAVIATALGSELGEKEEAPQETSPEAPAANVVPGVHDVPPDAPLPLRAILPLAPASAPVSKNGTMTHQAEPPAAALAEAGIDQKIDQVSNQLDGLIESLNGLLENTQRVFEQPVTESTGGAPPAEPTSKDPAGADMSSQGVTS